MMNIVAKVFRIRSCTEILVNDIQICTIDQYYVFYLWLIYVRVGSINQSRNF